MHTLSLVKWATVIGVKKPVVVPMKLITPYNVPAGNYRKKIQKKIIKKMVFKKNKKIP